MLRPLHEALGQWTPDAHAGRQQDPLALLAAGWSDIVGDDVARNTHPTRVLDGTLLVTTRSSAWSQQLTFLADRILAAVRARLPQTPVARLRFRVGKIPHAPRTRGPAVSPPPVGRRRSGVRPESRTAAEAMARFRNDVNERRRAKGGAGWKECRGCGAFIAPRTGALCITCANTAAERRSATAARLLFEAPWLGYAGTAALVEGLTPQEYESIRTRLLSRWWETLMRARASKRLSRDGRERTLASSYVVLKSRLAPEAIDPATLRNLLGDELYAVIYGTELVTRTNDQ